MKSVYKNKSFTFSNLSLMVILSLTGPTLVAAQSNSSNDSSLLQEVIVTAQKREQSANDIGMSISAFRGEDLETMGLLDTTDLAGLVPGLTMAMSSSGTPIYTMRGVGFNTPNMSSTSPVGVYLDEVSYPYPVMSKGLTFDVERVEVLKGPQGTLYGRNTTGGLINYINNKPTDDFHSYAKLEMGEYESYGFEGMVNKPLTDSLNARIAVKTDRANEGWQKSVSRGDKLGEVDRSAVKLSLNWEPSDNLNMLFSMNWWEDNSDTQAGQAINFNPEAPADYVVTGLPDAILVNPDSEDADWAGADTLSSDWSGSTSTPRPNNFAVDSDMLSLSNRIDWNINDSVTLTSISSYADMERNDFYDRDGTQFELVVFNDSGSIESFSQEIRLAGETDNLKYIAGLFYSQDEAKDRSDPWAGQTSILNYYRALVSAGAAAAGAPAEAVAEIAGGFREWNNYADIETESRAIFGQVEWAANDAVTLTLGVRYTEDESDFTGCSRDRGNGNLVALWNAFFGTEIPAGNCVTNEFPADVDPAVGAFPQPVDVVQKSLDEDNWSGRLAVDWRLNDNSLVYASYSRGYKSGAVPSLSANVANQYAPATQEKLDAFEIGIKSSIQDNLHVNLNAYHYQYEDKQVFGEIPDLIFTTLTRLVNVPESEVQGGELDITWAPTEQLVTQLNLSYMNTEITEYLGYNKFAEVTDFAGSEFEYSPKLQANGLISYGFSLSEQLDAQVTLDISHSGKQQGDFEGDSAFKVDAYTLVGLNVGLLPNNQAWEANFWMRNLTDEYYWTSVQIQTDTTFRYAGMPRTWGASLKYNF